MEKQVDFLIWTMVPTGFLCHFLAYIFGSLSVSSIGGIGFLYFIWSFAGLAGGFASWGLAGFLIFLKLTEDK